MHYNIKVGGINMEHDFSSGDISSDDFEEHHEHELKSKQHKLEMIAFEILKMVHTSPYSNFAKNVVNH